MRNDTFAWITLTIFLVVVFTMLWWVSAYGSNSTNSTSDMVLGDKWNCGYINTTTTLENLRDCYRD